MTESVLDRMRATIAARKLASPDTPVLLMVSGGSDSTALAYLAADLACAGEVGMLAMLHVNHCLRGEDSDADARFVESLASLLSIPLFMCEVDVAAQVERTGGNMEAVARSERYLAANEALESLCRHAGAPIASGRIFAAHTADDRVESFYMRSIVGTGPGGFRSMRYENGPVARPLLDVGREDLRDYLRERERTGAPCAVDSQGSLWREDATNAHTDRFRAFVRHEIVPLARERNPQLLSTLTRTMKLIADEDDYLEGVAEKAARDHVAWCEHEAGRDPSWQDGFRLLPTFGQVARPVARRVVAGALQNMLGPDARIETASVEAVLSAFEGERPKSGYVTNIQGDIAVSANKRGVLVEPMSAFRARRKR